MSEHTAQSEAPEPVFEPVVFDYEGQEIRAINDGFIVWMVAEDLAKILGCSRLYDLTGVIDDDNKGRHTVWSGNGPRTLITLSEYGCYQAIFRSRNSNVRYIRRWMAGTVIPQTIRTGKDARMTPNGTPPRGVPSGSLESTKVDHAHLRDVPTDAKGGAIADLMRDLMRLTPRRRQGPVPPPDHRRFPAVDDLIGATVPDKINKILWLEESSNIMADHCQTLEKMRREWEQDPAFTDHSHPLRKIVNAVTIDIDMAIEIATRLKRHWDEALQRSRPTDPESPSSQT